MKRPQCEVKGCGKQLVLPIGPKESPFLVVGEFPGKDEIIQGRPFVGKTGDILQREFARLGLNIGMFRLSNLWLHAPNPKKKKKDVFLCDVNWHLTKLAQEIKGRKAVLLMGSDLAKAMFGKGVTDITGLEMESTMFPGIPMMISPNPAQLVHSGMGEWRLALERWKEMIS